MIRLTYTNAIIWAYLGGIVALFFYSFTQIDLGLTVSRIAWIKDIITAFQYVGYFNRPVATYLFIAIVLFLYSIYIALLFSIKNFSRKQIWMLIIVTAIILGFSYNAFSYDLFNYIFDAKIITHYNQNPYEQKALDYPADPMLSFMHWTHRVYPYGPVWLALTVPLSYLGFNYFLLTFFLFKTFFIGCFLGTVWMIGKIAKHLFPKYESFSLAFFALSPFVLIESLVSAHNDSAMMFLLMVGMYYLIHKKYLLTFVFLCLAYGVKFAAAAYPLPLHGVLIIALGIGLGVFAKLQKKISWEIVFLSAGCLMIIPVIFASLRTNFQPWYLLLLFPFAALVSKKIYVFIPVTIISIFALAEYIPFLYFGNWDPPIPSYLLWIRIAGIASAAFVTLVFLFRNKAKNDTILSL